MSTVKLQNPLGHVIQEVTVVRNRHDSARKSFRKRSSQDTDSASKWLVGSSRSSMSGLDSSKRHNATRRRSPPESMVTSASHAGSSMLPQPVPAGYSGYAHPKSG